MVVSQVCMEKLKNKYFKNGKGSEYEKYIAGSPLLPIMSIYKF